MEPHPDTARARRATSARRGGSSVREALEELRGVRPERGRRRAVTAAARPIDPPRQREQGRRGTVGKQALGATMPRAARAGSASASCTSRTGPGGHAGALEGGEPVRARPRGEDAGEPRDHVRAGQDALGIRTPTRCRRAGLRPRPRTAAATARRFPPPPRRRRRRRRTSGRARCAGARCRDGVPAAPVDSAACATLTSECTPTSKSATSRCAPPRPRSRPTSAARIAAAACAPVSTSTTATPTLSRAGRASPVTPAAR